MNERLLQFIWQFQYFNTKHLTSVQGQQLQVIYAGQSNTNQGPDFLEAKIKIDDALLIGHAEIHVHSSDWNRHLHSDDASYKNVILHVVWKHDAVITDKNNKPVPEIELQPLVPKVLLQQYIQLLQSKGFVPCQSDLPVLSPLGWTSWKERLVAERSERKSKEILAMLATNNHHWEETFWQVLAKNFGAKTNAENFETIAKNTPVKILAKHKNQQIQIEALLMGQAGLLNENFGDDYPKLLQREYVFMQKKYQLNSLHNKPDFLRMRPANFPTIRLSQLAALVYQSSHLFSTIIEMKDIQQVKKLFDVSANDYWHYHYIFDEETVYRPKLLGTQMIDNLIINTVCNMLFAYGVYHNEQKHKDKAFNWMQALAPEQNNITKRWKQYGVINSNAFDSQALIELKNNYCSKIKCLDCAVGNKLLKPG